MICIKFKPNLKFKKECNILIDDSPIKSRFTLTDQDCSLLGAYELTSEIDSDLKLQFYIETPYNDKVKIPVNGDAIKNLIKYINVKESTNDENTIKEIVKYIQGGNENGN